MDFEKLCQELASTPATIRALLNGISQTEAQVRPEPDSWSMLEVICHLLDEEINDFRPRLDVILFHSDKDFPPNDPQAWITERRYNERDLQASFEGFIAERAKSLEWLRTLSDANWDTVYANEYGSIKAGDMLSAWVAHDMLHLRQLVELRHARVLRLTAPYDTAYAGE